MPESSDLPAKPPNGARIIVVRSRPDAKARRREVGMRWLRDQMSTAVALFGGALAFFSVYLAIRPPSAEEHHPVWITLSVVCAVLFVGAVWCQNRISIREKAKSSALLESMAADLAELKRKPVFVPEAAAPAVTIGTVSDDEPDVSLRFELPNGFELHNYGGDATDVSIAPITIDEYISDDWGNFKVTTAEQTVRFPVVDIDSGKSRELPPTHTYLGAPLPTTMERFFEAFITRRRVDALGVQGQHFPDPEKATREEIYAHMNESSRLRNEPIDIEMKVAFSNRKTGRRWEKVETLHFEPKTREARVIHGKPREVTASNVTPEK